MSEIRIRPRLPSDLDACVDALALVYRADDYPTNWPADPAGWLAPTATLRGWVAVTGDGTVVGHVILQAARDLDRLAHVSRLFVTPAGRGADLGARLLAQARQWAGAQGLSLGLEVVDAERSAAIALYERRGWQRVDTVAAHWTTPDGGTVMTHRYILPENAGPSPGL